MTRLIRTLIPAAEVVLAAAAPASSWDSQHWANVTHATHSYLTEYAIDQLAALYPQLQAYRAILIEGANAELHELPVSGVLYGIDLDAKRVEHRGTNEGTADIAGWWADSLAAYRAGNVDQAYFLLGVLLHMVEDMGVPAHAHLLYHQGNLTEFDNFEFMALFNWRPTFARVDRTDPGFAEPWHYYAYQQEWTLADAPDYRDTGSFSKTWLLASDAERALLTSRQARTAAVTMWTLRSAARAFGL
jgi:hypothetical protein